MNQVTRRSAHEVSLRMANSASRNSFLGIHGLALFFPSVFCCIIISIKKENCKFLSCLVIYPFEIWADLLRPENEF